jgi:hypothetical protein
VTTWDLHADAAKISDNSPAIKLFAQHVADNLQPIAAPGSFPRQGVTVPLPDFESKSSADQDWMLDQLVALGNGHPMFLRTDYWPGNAGFQTFVAKVKARPSIVLLPLLNYDPGNRPSVTAYAAQAKDLAALGYPYVNLLNEPNLGGWTPKDAADYTNAARSAIAGKALVVGPDVASNAGAGWTPAKTLQWAKDFHAAGGRVDVGAGNFYGAASPPAAANPAWNFWSQASALRQALGVPLLFCLEGGWKIASATARNYDGYGTITDTQYQTASVTTGLAARDAGVVDCYLAYSLLNDASPGGFGLYDNARVARPSYAVFKAGAK